MLIISVRSLTAGRIVNDLKLGAADSTAIGLFMDTGKDAFFGGIKVVKEN